MAEAAPASPPPSYTSLDEKQALIVETLKLAVKQKPDELQKSLISVFDTEQGAQIVEQVKKLSETALAIRASFNSVRLNLRKFDLKNYTVKGTSVDKLEPKWMTISDEYERLLKASRHAAMVAKAHIDQYITVILPMVDQVGTLSKEDISKELDQYINELDEIIGAGTGFAEGFDKVQVDATAFVAEMERVVQQVGADYDARIDAAKKEITFLRQKLQKWRDMEKTCIAALKWEGVGMLCGGALMLTGFLAPLGLVVVLVSALTALGTSIAGLVASININNTLADLKQKKAELEKLTREKDELVQIKELLETSKADISDLCDRLVQLANIWGFLRADAVSLKGHLAYAHDQPTAHGQKKTLGSKLAGAIYRKLGEVVTVYAAQLEPVKFEDGRGTLLR